MKTFPKWAVVVLIVILVAAIAVTAVYASGGGVIYACVNPAGHLRIINYGESCSPSESYLEWNIIGPPGPAGPEGPQGPEGPPGLANVSSVSSWGTLDSDDSKTHVVWCPEGKVAISGGYNISGGGPNIVVRTFHPQWQPGDSGAPTGWQVSAHEIEPTSLEWQILAVAVCADVAE